LLQKKAQNAGDAIQGKFEEVKVGGVIGTGNQKIGTGNQKLLGCCCGLLLLTVVPARLPCVLHSVPAFLHSISCFVLRPTDGAGRCT
jgi:hypothetical protein